MGSGQSSASAAEGSNWKWSTGKRKRDGKMKVPPHAESSRVLFLLYLIHRTWNVVIEHVDSKSARWRGSQTTRLSNPGTAPRESQLDSLSLGRESDAGSQYSFCSCSYCRMRDGADDRFSDLTDCDIMASQGAWNEDHVAKEKQRPPIYNAEDYALSLRKWGRKTPPGAAGLYSAMLEPPAQEAKARTLPNQTSKDYRNPCLSPGEEMSLRQFGTASELLTKLRADLRLAFPSFVQEFVCEDGVALLLELLRGVQASQAGSPGGAPPGRPPPAVARRALLDELACLQCLWSCCTRYPEASRKLVAGPCGLYTLTVCIMSTVNKSRIIALQLLTKACNPPANGHVTISEALSTLRLRFGEPVRFRFLVGMLLSGGGSGELQAVGLGFLNALLASAPGPQRKLYLQAELEQAGFDIVTFRKMISKNTTCSELIVDEIEQYEKQLIDIDTLSEKATEAEKEKDDLKTKLDLLEKRVKILQEEKGILKSLEKCLKEKCCELQEEVTSLRSEHGNSNRKKLSKNKLSLNRDESSPPEDEGISSSERSLSPDDDLQREPLIYEVFNVKNETFDLIRNNKHIHKKFESKRKAQEHNIVKKISDDEEETTIDEVIEELRNIVNDAESEQYAKDKSYGDDSASRCNQTSEINVSIKAFETRQHKQLEKEDSITSTRHSFHIVDSTEYLNEIVDAEDEQEIVPTKIFPHPPRKSKSLVHLFVPPVEQGVLYNKQDHLYDDGCYSSDEGSDSLLSASRYQNQYKKGSTLSTYDAHDFCPNSNRALLNSIMDARDRVHSDTKEHIRLSRTRSGEALCKKQSLKRSESFQHTGTRTDTVVSDHFKYSRGQIDSLFYGNETNASPFGTVNNLNRSDSKSHLEIEECNPLADSKILTKSLDRIDEGLDSMVDIVMLSESKKTDWPYDWKGKRSGSRANSEIGNQSPTSYTAKSNGKYNSPQHSIYRHDSKVSSRKDDRNSTKLITDSSQRFFIPHSKLSTTSSDNNYNNTSFMLKRGHTNAGYYSGQPMLRDAPASMTSLGVAGGNLHSDLKRTLSPTGPKSLSGQSSVTTGKVTDIPSGLY